MQRGDRPEAIFMLFIVAFGLPGCQELQTAELASQAPANAEDLTGFLSNPSEPEPVPTEVAGSFTPPNPTRENPFQVEAQKLISEQTSLTLKGFVQLENPKVVLDVDNTIVVMKKGDRNGDLEIIDIDPPFITYRLADVQQTLTFGSH